MSIPRPAAIAAASLLAALPACSRAPAEPDPPPPLPAASISSTPAVPPLLWDAPGTWTTLDVPRTGPKRAAYKVPRAANDKEDAEVTVLFYGTGSQGDVDKNFKEWFAQFDGDAGAGARRDSFEAHGLHVQTVEVEGTYKIGLTPTAGSQKRSAVQMVKRDHRLIGAAVTTPDRGNWFFKLTGPDETVQAARSALRALLDSVH